MEKIFGRIFPCRYPIFPGNRGDRLGLPLSKKLVELHGGKLSVESRDSVEVPRSGLLCLLYPGEGCKMEKKASVVDDNGTI